MMKTLKNLLIAGITCVAMVFTISSCQKGFDAKSYAPKKPLPTFGGYSSSKDIEPASLVAYWAFNGNLTDSLSATAATGTTTGFDAGVKGQGLNVPANGYAVSNVPDAVKSLHSFTISTWVKMPQNTGAAGVIDIAHTDNFWGNFDIFFDNGGTATTGVLKVHVWNKSGSTSGSDAWEGGYTVANPWNAWINILVTYNNDTSTVTVFYNGSSAGTNTAAGFAPLDWSGAKKMSFGTLQFQTTPSLTTATGKQDWAASIGGTIDQVRIYSKVLSASQVTALYNLEKLGR